MSGQDYAPLRPLTPRPSPVLGASAEELAALMNAMNALGLGSKPEKAINEMTPAELSERNAKLFMLWRLLAEELAVARGLVTEDELESGDCGLTFEPSPLCDGTCWVHYSEEQWERLAYYQQATHRTATREDYARIVGRVDIEGVDREKAQAVDPDESAVSLELPDERRKIIEMREARAEIDRATKSDAHRWIITTY